MLAVALDELCQLNAEIRGVTRTAYRTESAFCLSRRGETIAFCDAADVERSLVEVMAAFVEDFEAAATPEHVAWALAFFWVGFIAVHPFADGNGRTALRFIEKSVTTAGYVLKDNWRGVLTRYLIRGDVQADLHNVKMIFKVLLMRPQ